MVSQLLADHPQQISEIRKEDGTTPLMLAAKIGDIAMVKFLIEKGAKVDQQDQKSGMTPLTQAVFHG